MQIAFHKSEAIGVRDINLHAPIKRAIQRSSSLGP
ncbi:hypothetical protein HNE_1612 [Hyphomonas neptunium ATCC 15444]|uniref:Uncharacterized protein n=1 Tax=Hyphomonas neptunium (strain ATCC 15444) TaxID=228405 RepID=Q0C1S3_HYPNA|nr:hypothetical protein HNE_1612 [Hyphomonas neptunium ATCC 15444]